MKSMSILAIFSICTLLSSEVAVVGQSTAFTYEGRLRDGQNVASGNYDLQFVLFNAATFGDAVGGTNTAVAVPVSEGVFSVTLDFGGAVFDGGARWLEISVRSNGSGGSYVGLTPRQPVTTTPYAIRAGNAALLNGQAPNAFAPAIGSAEYVAKGGDTMTGTLALPANGLVVGGNQIVMSSGNVGIGTTAPEAQLHVLEPTGVVVANFESARETSVIRLSATAPTGRTWALESSVGKFQIGDTTANADRFVIDTVGNVGIGTTSPQARLEVIGTVRANAFTGDGSGLTGVSLSGVAGGDLTGNFPNPVIANSAVTSSKIAADAVTGSKIASGQVVKSVNALRDNVSITGGANIAVTTSPNGIQISASGGTGGTAGGDLTGTYPNPSIANGVVTSAKIADGTITDADISSSPGISASKISGGDLAATRLLVGFNSNLSGSGSTIAGGEGHNINNAPFASIGGGSFNTIDGSYATIPGGRGAVAMNYGQQAYASGFFGVSGEAQTSVYVLRRVTQNNSLTELFLDGAGQRMRIRSPEAWSFEIVVIARAFTSSSGVFNSAAYEVKGVVENEGGTVNLIGLSSVTLRGLEGGASSPNVLVQADSVNDALTIKVQSPYGNFTTRWVAFVRTVEVKM